MGKSWTPCACKSGSGGRTSASKTLKKRACSRPYLIKQAKGNAIEWFGKNFLGLRTALLHEAIFPFVCYGCDFAANSSILDRVSNFAMFGELNQTHLHNSGNGGRFNRGSFYFRKNKWTVDEMEVILNDIAERSVYYYFSKYGKEHFVHLLPA